MIAEAASLCENISSEILKNSLIETKNGNISVINSLINKNQYYTYDTEYNVSASIHINTNYGHFMYFYFEDTYQISRKLDYGKHLATFSNNSTFMFCYYPKTLQIYGGTLSDKVIDFFNEYNVEYITDITNEIEFYAKLKGLW